MSSTLVNLLLSALPIGDRCWMSSSVLPPLGCSACQLTSTESEIFVAVEQFMYYKCLELFIICKLEDSGRYIIFGRVRIILDATKPL